MTKEKGHILVVDDNRINRLKLSMTLQQQGHVASLAEDGRQGLEMLKSGSFDAVLLDIIMPGMDGFEVLDRIKCDPEMRDIPVIVISALDEMDGVVKCIEMGAEDYLPKLFDPVLLQARLNSCMQKKKLRDLEKAYLQQEMTLRQNEKLATLGKLSAGMAHELNNPAAASQRAAAQLQGMFTLLQHSCLGLVKLALTETQVDDLLSLESQAQERVKNPVYLDPIIRSDKEDEMEDWLTEQGIENAWEIAPTLVNLGNGIDELKKLVNNFSQEQARAALNWLNASINITSLVEEIQVGSGRISEIVQALKVYTYLDQAPIQNVDIHEGLENTLMILHSKLARGISVQSEYAEDLPRIEAYGSELNQVWTNLIDNAIDATNGDGKIILKTDFDDEWVYVEIQDNGHGISEQNMIHLFDPFFTTKPPGMGTGLGLSITHNIIVQKHKGEINVTSQNGATRFVVQLPHRLAGSGDTDN